MSSSSSTSQIRPLIGCTSYRKEVNGSTISALSRTYLEAISAAGGIPLLIPVGLGEEDMQAAFDRVDGILLPGGGDIDPSRYGDEVAHDSLRDVDSWRDDLELYMARAAVKRRKPVLAICRGHQVFNVALGGTLWQDIASQMPGDVGHDLFRIHPRNHIGHSVDLLADSTLAHHLAGDRASVNSLHHQGIRRLAAELTAVATAPDGLIEGVEVMGHPFAVGVQWHPEDLIHDDPAMFALFKGFVAAAGQGRA